MYVKKLFWETLHCTLAVDRVERSMARIELIQYWIQFGEHPQRTGDTPYENIPSEQ